METFNEQTLLLQKELGVSKKCLTALSNIDNSVEWMAQSIP